MLLLRLLALLTFVVGFASGQALTLLPPEEVEALKIIAKTMGNTKWNFSEDPCSPSSGWIMGKSTHASDVCDCTFHNNTLCHVIRIVLKTRDLSGSAPAELTRLPCLREIDLNWNYLGGIIPREWGSMKLTAISLAGNRLTGSIPKELGNISTLVKLNLNFNQLSGSIPPELGNLPGIETLVLMSNNLTGEIPLDLANLTTLTNFQISGNNFTGQLPDFIQNWTKVTNLSIQATGLSGPIPPGIASLAKLTDLRISDLSGHESAFPPLSNMRNITYLILRSCNIIGELPSYIGELTQLKLLDLSFNKLEGPINESFGHLVGADFIYLSGNSLSGLVPSKLLTEGREIDLSYNNFTSETISLTSNCQARDINLFASSKGHTIGIVSCLKSLHCDKNYTSLYINCGGGQVVDEKGNTYEDDMGCGGPTCFYSSKTNWGCSNTGHFLDGQHPRKYTLTNSSSIFGQNTQLYTTARLSPLSLTYYGFCLMNGNYTVNLHFSEIKFTNDNTYRSLGRRIFDVYVQEKLVLKDFNIANEAGGVNKAIRRNFTAVVDENTLEIRFYWAGKGTTDIPASGVYGPLISAISVDPNFPLPSENNRAVVDATHNISRSAIVGILVAILFVVSLVLSILWWKGCLGCKETMLHDLRGLNRHTGSFSLRLIKAATNNFHPTNKIGEGGFGPVYKGCVSNGTIIAVKKHSAQSKQGNREFLNELGMISALQHPHLVELYGCCVEGNQLLLVYEYMENNSLARALFGPEEKQKHLDWPTRYNICIGIARGLAYLHEESRFKIVHRDITATNVLLDKNFVAKISDFGLAKLDEGDETHISTRVAGTFGYMAPEYAMRGYLTDKADVYSFGVVLLEIVTGESNSRVKSKEATSFNLLDKVNSLKEKGNLLELVDPRLKSNFNEKEVMTTVNLALLCTNAVASERPNMLTVVSILEGKPSGYGFDSSISVEKMKSKEMAMNHGDGLSVSMIVPWTSS